MTFELPDPLQPYASPRIDTSLPRRREEEAYARQMHSGLGITSFVIAIVSGVGSFVIVMIAGMMEMSNPGGLDETSPEAMAIGLGILGAMAMSLLGVGLGIGGLVQPNRLRLWSALGLIFNAMVLLGVGGLMVLGTVMEA